MRTDVLKTTSVKDVEKIERESREILGNLMVTVENYPNLKTSEPVKNLMNAIQSVEDEIARHRFTKLSYLHFEEEETRKPEVKWNV